MRVRSSVRNVPPKLMTMENSSNGNAYTKRKPAGSRSAVTFQVDSIKKSVVLLAEGTYVVSLGLNWGPLQDRGNTAVVKVV